MENQIKKIDETKTTFLIGANNLKTENEKIEFFDKVISCEDSVADIMNQKKRIKAVYIDKQRLEKENGSVISNRLVFSFEDGSYCMTFSEGIFIAFKRLVAIFGEPPYNFDIAFRSVEKGKSRVYTIEIFKNEVKNE